MLQYPGFNPIAIEIGPLKVHWYGIMYLIGFAGAWWLARLRAARPGSTWKASDVDDLIFYDMLGVILGGRIGYVLFYGLSFWAKDLLYPFKIYEGGMSFHGGLLGVVIAVWLFCRHRKLKMMPIADLACAFAPIGLFFGRLANFVNGELWGRAADVPWAMIFPRDPYHVPRHPSQLYEAALEGVVLFALMQIALRVFRANERPGLISALFFLGYGTFRFICEFFREPDTQFIGPISMGMALSIPVWLGAAILFWVAARKPKMA